MMVLLGGDENRSWSPAEGSDYGVVTLENVSPLRLWGSLLPFPDYLSSGMTFLVDISASSRA